MAKQITDEPVYNEFFASKALLLEIREYLEDFAELDIGLHTRADLSAFNLSEARFALERLKQHCASIDTSSLDEPPEV